MKTTTDACIQRIAGVTFLVAALAAASPSLAIPDDSCTLITASEAATVLDNPGPPASGDSGISKDCTYSRDDDHLDLSVDVLPNDRAKMEAFRGVYDQKDITILPGVGDVAFLFFPGHEEIRYQQRSMVVLKGSTRFILNLYRKHGVLGDAFNAKLAAVAKAIAGRL
jgi:hypothetical protein